GVSDVVHVRHQAVANAVGAAIAQVSGEVDQIFQNLSREEAIATARRLAERRAVEAGADAAGLQVVDVEDLPLAYLPGNSLRVRVRVVGDIAERSVGEDLHRHPGLPARALPGRLHRAPVQ